MIVLSEEVFARTVLALIGLAFGLIPLIFGIIRRQYVIGAAAAVICAIVSAVGLPYLSVLIAPAACYPIYAQAKKKDEAARKKHRADYQKYLQAQKQNPETRTNGWIENKNVANAAWPPVEQMMDASAAAEFQRLTEEAEASLLDSAKSK